jgi:hypothetical protein
MYQSLRVILPLCLVASACDDEGVSEAAQAGDAGGEMPFEAAEDVETDTPASIGPVSYRFAPDRLARAEIQLTVPPDHETRVWATKLIPSERANLLGEERCRYGTAESLQTCTAELEDGLALAMLEHPFAHYRGIQNEPAAAGDEATRPTVLAGTQGFELTELEDSVRLTYAFYPAGERTLLVTQRSSPGARSPDPAILDVLDSVQFPEPN